MPPRLNNQDVRTQLRIMEDHIKQRSKAAENKWSLDKTAVNLSGSTITRVLAALEALDTHVFSRVGPNNCIDSLYAKIFLSAKENSDTSQLAVPSVQNPASTPPTNAKNAPIKLPVCDANEEAIVRTLCEWAVTTQRSGEHRALVVARLLEKRQTDMLPPESEEKDDQPNPYVFHDLLLKFLDTQAPVYDENSLSQRSLKFGNLMI